MVRPYLKLGEILVKEGIITRNQLDEVIKVQAKEGGRLGEILLKMGIATEEDIVVALGKQLNLTYVSMGAGLLKPATEQIWIISFLRSLPLKIWSFLYQRR